MSKKVFEKCLEIIGNTSSIRIVDITGGAPEMNPNLEWFLSETARLGKKIIVRSNLVILLLTKYAHFIDLFADLGVEVVASMPDYHQEKTDRQRGMGTFNKSMTALKLLNKKG